MVKAGILGGGQLGRMLLQQAANYPVTTFVMENDFDCPASHLCHHFVLGDIRSYNDVYAFGKQLDVLTIEIESINIEALEKLEAEGLKIFPRPSILKVLKNKIYQKEFYANGGHHTAPFIKISNSGELEENKGFLPFVQKLAEGGYDGRGVQLMRSQSDLVKGFDAKSVLEKLVDVEKELAVIVAISSGGESAVYPPVEMIFDEELNLLDYQLCPAAASAELIQKAQGAALKVAESFQSPGLFAIELFLDKSGEIFINETAPRVHNSGHHSIEANYCSQYDMLWRIMLDYPLGDPGICAESALVNIVGAKNFSGEAKYIGLDEVLQYGKAYVHLYGKRQTKPGRKMGHVTLLGNDRLELVKKAKHVKETLQVIS